jgi:hypothetical protein
MLIGPGFTESFLDCVRCRQIKHCGLDRIVTRCTLTLSVIYEATLTNPYKPLTLDCRDWARAKHRSLKDSGAKVRYLCIEPKHGYGYSNIGTYTLPSNRWPGNKKHPTHSGGNYWTHHFAVIYSDNHVTDFVVDELYPDGMDLASYKSLFDERDMLDFTQRKKLWVR